MRTRTGTGAGAAATARISSGRTKPSSRSQILARIAPGLLGETVLLVEHGDQPLLEPGQLDQRVSSVRVRSWSKTKSTRSAAQASSIASAARAALPRRLGQARRVSQEQRALHAVNAIGVRLAIVSRAERRAGRAG